MALYQLDNFRHPEQLADMQALENAGICIFCPQHLTTDPNHPVLHQTAHWVVTTNKYPYAETRLHLLLVPRAHVEDLLDLEPAARDEYWTVLRWVRDTYGLTFYSIGSRNGDGRYTGSSIAHVHVHVVVGDVDDPEHRGVRFKMSHRPRD
ncbi:HIT domain-containing protein [Planosporangium thailandense]|uniref:HIT domain-containing protein n=1 Tax=Planosporangium thailandense TaxID=765197 RepID=A0ABX0Y625_9ACTN|nr:HIT domain-containing protein [Planosporangium thailandense]NJC72875.1 HIT domain-containing protein [Planosporangium thailandense]